MRGKESVQRPTLSKVDFRRTRRGDRTTRKVLFVELEGPMYRSCY